MPTVRFWLAGDGQRILIQVWDGCDLKPERQEPALATESGRGLLLVEAISSHWGCYPRQQNGGKIVWALL